MREIAERQLRRLYDKYKTSERPELYKQKIIELIVFERKRE